jgi:transposase
MEQNRAARVSDGCVRRLNRSLLNQIKKQIEQLDLLIKEYIEASPALSAKAQKLTLINGVGARTAALLLAQMPACVTTGPTWPTVWQKGTTMNGDTGWINADYIA